MELSQLHVSGVSLSESVQGRTPKNRCGQKMSVVRAVRLHRYPDGSRTARPTHACIRNFELINALFRADASLHD